MIQLLLGDGFNVVPFEMEIIVENGGREKEAFVLFVVLILDDIDIGGRRRFYYVSVLERLIGIVCICIAIIDIVLD